MSRPCFAVRAFLAFAVFLAVAPGVAAQGLYYREVEKGGQLFVFNGAAAYAAWARSGDTDKTAVTRPGYGPAGETVVFDSLTAIELYNFKHGIAELVERPPVPKAQVSYKDG